MTDTAWYDRLTVMHHKISFSRQVQTVQCIRCTIQNENTANLSTREYLNINLPVNPFILHALAENP